jgi:hypothetical protein
MKHQQIQMHRDKMKNRISKGRLKNLFYTILIVDVRIQTNTINAYSRALRESCDGVFATGISQRNGSYLVIRCIHEDQVGI